MSTLDRAASRPRVAVIGTGGTFAMHGRNAYDWVEYSESGVVHSIDTLLGDIDDLGLDIEVLPVTFRALGSTGIVPADWLELARLIADTAKADPSIAGFVVTHGTATMEETAWFLDLALNVEVPVVLTGAQRPKNTSGSDAMANLRGALAVASSDVARGFGVLLVMGGSVFPARDATKTSSFDLDAFEAVPFGPLGRIDADGHVTIRRRPFIANSERWHATLDKVTALPRVDMVISYAGADGSAIDSFVALGAKGLISVGLPPGRPANGERDALKRAVAAGVVVVQTSRAARGNVPPQDFLARDGILAGGDLAAHKLRIMLMLALCESADPQRVQRIILDA